MVTFENVSFSYQESLILDDLNFKLNQGEFVFLIGKSGSGKSTFLQMIYMNLFPSHGRVKVGDYVSDKIKTRDLPFLRRKIGIVFQEFRLLSDRNIFDNLAFVLEVTNTPRKEIKKRINNVLSDVGLSHRRSSMPNELSGGEQQRVAIARAMVNEPALILADEPTGNLDPDTSLEILDIFKKINLRGTSIIFATHNYELVKKASSLKIIKLENGKALKVVLKQKDLF
jgi:cell division transport system ATP-binding protein